IFFIAPPWGSALDEVAGLDLRRTTPPITNIFEFIRTKYPSQRMLLVTQVYEKLNPTSLRDVQALLDWSDLRVYDLNDAGKNHGILLGTSGWNPSFQVGHSDGYGGHIVPAVLIAVNNLRFAGARSGWPHPPPGLLRIGVIV